MYTFTANKNHPIPMRIANKTSAFIAIVLLAGLTACSSSSKTSKAAKKSHDDLLMAVAWYQNSAEMTALYYQGFNIARMRLDESLAQGWQLKPLAVVVDIDETMLDNSPFETTLINTPDSQEGWYDWTARATAKALPGALEFAQYTQSKKVELFYITNRDDRERANTLINLQREGFPFADEAHLLTKSDLSYSSGNTSSKVERRARVSEKFEIILLIGDNLNDFSGIFENRSENYGKDAVALNKELFGKRFIVLPNPMYGAWEKPLFDYQEGLDQKQKSVLLKSKLRSQ